MSQFAVVFAIASALLNLSGVGHGLSDLSLSTPDIRE